MVYDLIIIGSGPIGLACGIEAEKAELNYVILEKGCLVNSLFNYPQTMTFFSTSDKLEVGNVPFLSIADKPKRAEALEYYRRVSDQWSLNIKYYEEVTDIKTTDNTHIVTTLKQTYKTKNITIAIGFYDTPKLLNILGENLPKVKHYYQEPHPFIGQKLLVIGAAHSAVDVALQCYRKGVDVTMVIRDTELRPSLKFWIKPDIENRIEEGAIKAYFESEVTEIKEKEVVIKTPNGLVNIENDFVMAMTGYKPDLTLLKSAGVKLQNDEYSTPVYSEETHETNIKGIYLAGVICGGLKTNKLFIENSREHAIKITSHIKPNYTDLC